MKLSTKNNVLVLNDKSEFYLDDKEAEYVKKCLKENVKYIEIGNNLIQTFYIMKIISGGDYKNAERIKNGEYKCSSCDQWIPKGKQCGNC